MSTPKFGKQIQPQTRLNFFSPKVQDKKEGLINNNNEKKSIDFKFPSLNNFVNVVVGGGEEEEQEEQEEQEEHNSFVDNEDIEGSVEQIQSIDPQISTSTEVIEKQKTSSSLTSELEFHRPEPKRYKRSSDSASLNQSKVTIEPEINISEEQKEQIEEKQRQQSLSPPESIVNENQEKNEELDLYLQSIQTKVEVLKKRMSNYYEEYHNEVREILEDHQKGVNIQLSCLDNLFKEGRDTICAKYDANEVLENKLSGMIQMVENLRGSALLITQTKK